MEQKVVDTGPSDNLFFNTSKAAGEKTGSMKLVNKLALAVLQLGQLLSGAATSKFLFLDAVRSTDKYLGGTGILKTPWDLINITESLKQGQSAVVRAFTIFFNLGDTVFTAIGFYELMTASSVVGNKLGSINFFGNSFALSAYNIADLSICTAYIFDTVDIGIGFYKAFSEKGLKAITDIKISELKSSKVAWKVLANSFRVTILSLVFLGYGSTYWWFLSLKVILGVINVRNVTVGASEARAQDAEAVKKQKEITSHLETISAKC